MLCGKKSIPCPKDKNIPIYQIFDSFGNFIIAPFSAFVNPKAKICPNFLCARILSIDFSINFLLKLVKNW